jgi:hypothetical protein
MLVYGPVVAVSTLTSVVMRQQHIAAPAALCDVEVNQITCETVKKSLLEGRQL